MANQITCTVKMVPPDKLEVASATAIKVNARNAPSVHVMRAVAPGRVPTKTELAVLTTKYWGSTGVDLTVSFLDGPEASLRTRILRHMNAWGRGANVRFNETTGQANVRIARTPSDGYWSYIGTDIHTIASTDPTMNLDSFSNATPESEFVRVVRHETGHTLGFPHEHLRKELIDKIDVAKAIAYFKDQYGWDEEMTRSNVLTPIEEVQLIATPVADVNSIMCYELPGQITKDGQPIVGGSDIDPLDKQFAAELYPPRNPLLQVGSSGPDVAFLQGALTELGFDPGAIDGIFGPKTALGVTSYQSARGLTVDGIVGPHTWAALHADGF